MIPRIDISPLFSGPTPERAKADAAIIAAASDAGFMTVCGLPPDIPIGAEPRRRLLRLFDLPASVTRALWRQKFDPAHRNIYRGWFPLQNGVETYKEGIDIGPDIARGAALVDGTDPLKEATPLPPERALPGWRNDAAAYFLAMERLAQALMRVAGARAWLAGRGIRPDLRGRDLDLAPDPLSGAPAGIDGGRS